MPKARLRIHRSVTWERVNELTAELRAERARRVAAERTAARFHAMLLAERIKHLPAQDDR